VIARTVGRHDHHSICSHFHAVVLFSQPGVAGTCACRLATSADRLAAAPSPPAASFRRPASMGVPLPNVAAGPRRLGTRPTGDGGQMASQGLSDLLAVAITLSRTPQDESRNPGPDPSDQPRQSDLSAQARHRGAPAYRRAVAQRTPKDQCRGPHVYSPDQPREFRMRRTFMANCSNSRATAGLSAHPDVAHLPTEPSIGHPREGSCRTLRNFA